MLLSRGPFAARRNEKRLRMQGNGFGKKSFLYDKKGNNLRKLEPINSKVPLGWRGW
jgi:hypothetical protein